MNSESQLQHKSEKNTHALNETCSMTLFCFDLVFFCCLMYSVLDLRPSEVSLCMETAFLYLTGKEKCKYLNERKGKKEFVHVVLSSVNL